MSPSPYLPSTPLSTDTSFVTTCCPGLVRNEPIIPGYPREVLTSVMYILELLLLVPWTCLVLRKLRQKYISPGVFSNGSQIPTFWCLPSTRLVSDPVWIVIQEYGYVEWMISSVFRVLLDRRILRKYHGRKPFQIVELPRVKLPLYEIF